MTDQPDGMTPAGDGASKARKVGTSRAERRAARQAGKRRGKNPQRTVLLVITASLLTLGIATGGTVVLAYNEWNNNLETDPIDDQLRDRPEKKDDGPQGPLNILVMGSDTREGEGNNVDGMQDIGERSDTTIMIHLSADREFAYGISVPRDTLVDRPDCYAENGDVIPGADDVMWNDAFSVGGPACTIQQFEQLTDVRIDNYVVVDFGGFKDMVDALGGVEVCIPEEIDDSERNIVLEPGTREISGDEALSYVRVRYNVGTGIDPERIRRQQAFMASMISKAVSGGMLVRPDRLRSFISALTDSITTDFENVAQLVSLGRAFAGVGLDDVRFVTTPWQFSPEDENRVEWLPEVEELWQLVNDDDQLTEQFLSDSISAADNPDGTTTDEPSTEETSEATDEESESAGKRGKRRDRDEDTSDVTLSDEAREQAGLCS